MEMLVSQHVRLGCFFTLLLLSALSWGEDYREFGGHQHGLNDGYAHHDEHSGKYITHKNRWEWPGPHKGCHVRGRHFHQYQDEQGNVAGALDCGTAIATPGRLWPANHRYSTVKIDGLQTVDGRDPELTIQCVYQDEPLNGIADGNTDIDALISPDGQLKLRKERAGRRSGVGNGRVYHVAFEARDLAAGDLCQGSVAVEVPHRPWGKAKDDGRLYVSLDNGFNCNGVNNQPPVISSEPVTSATELVLYEYAVSVSDPDSDVLGYRLLRAPEGMEIGAEGIIHWLPAQGTAGSHSVTVEVNDGDSSVAQTFTLVVSPRSNTAPQITSSPLLNAVEAQAYQYQLTAIDNENDNFGFALAAGPVGFSVSIDGLVQWTPIESQVGAHDIRIEVMDMLGAVSTQSYVLSVAPKPNDLPEILSTPIVTINEDELYQYTILATDPEGTSLSYRLPEAPAGLTLTANTLDWTPTFDDAGEYPVTIEVEDADGGTVLQTFLLTVLDVNRPPLFISAPVLTVAENTLYQYKPEAIDDDNDIVFIDLLSAPVDMTLNQDGLIEWMPTYDDAGIHSVEIAATDDRGGESTDQFLLTVTNVNRDPQITSEPIEAATENIVYNYQVEASDDDGQGLVYSLLQSPIGMTVSDSGLIEWMPGFDAAGEASVEVAVSDGESTITQAFVIVVTNTNQLPVAIDQAVSIAEDTAVSITLNATDADTDTLTYSFNTYPVHGAVEIAGGQVSYMPSANFAGMDSFTFIVSDGVGESEPAMVTITVNAVNDSPRINFSPILTAQENVTYTVDVNASDVDGDSLMFGLANAPDGMSIDVVTGRIRWLPDFDQAGDHSVIIVATDSLGASDSFSYTISVANTNRSPNASDIAVQTLDSAIDIALIGDDVDGDALIYIVEKNPLHGIVVVENSIATYTPDPGFSGSDSFTYRALDVDSASSPATVLITVRQANSAPTISSSPLSIAHETAIYRYQVFANDAEGDEISYALAVAPDGMSIQETTGLIQWDTPLLGEHVVSVTATDAFGANGEQEYALRVSSALPEQTTLGTDFWLMFNRNFSAPDSLQVFISSLRDTSATVQVPGLDYSQGVDVVAGNVTAVELADLLGEKSRELGVNNFAVHVTSDDPVAVYGINLLPFSTDAMVVYPTQSLGQIYSVVAYDQVDNSMKANFGIVGIVDNTNIWITPTADISIDAMGTKILAGEKQLIELHRSETLQVEAANTVGDIRLKDISGTLIESDQPIAVFSGNQCAAVAAVNACDHLVEQLLPVDAHSAIYYTYPLASRLNGDTFRVYASEDDTYVNINGRFEYLLQAGEYYTTIINEPSEIKSNRPVQLAQFANGWSYDNQQGDPFMTYVPAVEQFLSAYTVATPASGFSSHYINLITTLENAATITVNGEVVDQGVWEPLQNSNYVGASLSIAAGAYTVIGDQPFGLYIYGFNQADSYGYVGGVGLPEAEQAQFLNLQLSTSPPIVGEQVCIEAALTDLAFEPISVTQVRFDVINENRQRNKQGVAITDTDGRASFCYTRGSETTDTVIVESSGLSQQMAIDWVVGESTAVLRPVIESLPAMTIIPGEVYSYSVFASDPERQPLIYALARSPAGMQINTQTGHITWDVPLDMDVTFTHDVDVSVTDEAGLTAIQKYRLFVPLTGPLANQTPVLTTTLPAMLNADELFTQQLQVLDPEGEAIVFELIAAPPEVSLDSTGLLSWTPKAADDNPVVFALSDGSSSIEIVWQPQIVEPLSADLIIDPFTVVQEGGLMTLSVNVNGAVGEAVIELSIDGVLQTLDLNNTLSFTAQGLGVHTISLQVTDEAAQPRTLTLAGTYTVQEANVPPQITSSPPFVVSVGDLYSYQIQAVDTDALTYQLDAGPAGMTVSPDGLINWATSSVAAGTYTVAVSVSDGATQVTQEFAIYVIDNPGGTGNSFSLINEPMTEAFAGVTYDYFTAGIAGNGAPVTIALIDPPTGMTITADSPYPEFYQLNWVPDEANCQRVVTLELSDDQGNSEQISFTIDVYNAPKQLNRFQCSVDADFCPTR